MTLRIISKFIWSPTVWIVWKEEMMWKKFLFFRCLVHILKETTVCYSKIRPLTPQSQLDLCRHEVRYGCVREDDCFYAHSLVELKVWMMQHERGEADFFEVEWETCGRPLNCVPLAGITPEEIVQEAKRYWNATASLQGTQVGPQQTLNRYTFFLYFLFFILAF